MPSTPPPLWPGYDEASEDDLLSLLESRLDAAFDDSDPTVDVRAAKDFARAIASHEWLKQNKLGGEGYRQRLHMRAEEVQLESWRP